MNPTKENPIETSEFLSHLYIGFLDPILEEMFSRFERIKQKVYARITLVIYMEERLAFFHQKFDCQTAIKQKTQI